MINNTTLVGRLTKNPELRYTGSGTAVANFTLAVERNYKNAQGERETDFINCVIWREPAETLNNFAVKGSLIGVTGNIETRSYQNNEGKTVYVTEINANNFQMLEPKSVNDERRAQSGGRQNQPPSQKKSQQQNDNPFANVDFNSNDPFANQDDVTDIDDDDLPF